MLLRKMQQDKEARGGQAGRDHCLLHGAVRESLTGAGTWGKGAVETLGERASAGILVEFREH